MLSNGGLNNRWEGEGAITVEGKVRKTAGSQILHWTSKLCLGIKIKALYLKQSVTRPPEDKTPSAPVLTSSFSPLCAVTDRRCITLCTIRHCELFANDVSYITALNFASKRTKMTIVTPLCEVRSMFATHTCTNFYHCLCIGNYGNKTIDSYANSVRVIPVEVCVHRTYLLNMQFAGLCWTNLTTERQTHRCYLWCVFTIWQV